MNANAERANAPKQRCNKDTGEEREDSSTALVNGGRNRRSSSCECNKKDSCNSPVTG